jgi:uncharacterized spore protein YtfJ
MDIKELVSDAREVFNARRVIGEPYERNGVTVIPVAAIGGGGGGGGGAGSDGDKGQGSGGGGGFGMGARPVGAWVIRGDDVKWVPAVDVNRLIAGAQILGVVALLTMRSIARARVRRAKLEARRSKKSD